MNLVSVHAYQIVCALNSLKTNPGHVAQLVASLIADPGLMNWILAWLHTPVEIDHLHSPPSPDSRRP